MLINPLLRKGRLVLSASVSYRVITENLDRSLKNTAEKPQVARDTKYYLDNIGKVKSLDDFLADDRLYNYAMKAGGLSDMAYAKAFMRKVLTEGVDEPKSFANSLADKRYQKFAETFNFARYGSATTAFERTQQGTVDNYVRQTLEENAGAENEGTRLALYFQRMAPTVESTMGLLADKAMLQVVHTAFQIPELTALMDLDKQVEMIEKRLDIADLKDPDKLKSLLQRFTSLWELKNSGGASGVGVPNAAVILGQANVGISGDILSAIQNLKLGGG
jgi:hypothetical protein